MLKKGNENKLVEELDPDSSIFGVVNKLSTEAAALKSAQDMIIYLISSFSSGTRRKIHWPRWLSLTSRKWPRPLRMCSHTFHLINLRVNIFDRFRGASVAQPADHIDVDDDEEEDVPNPGVFDVIIHFHIVVPF